MASPSTGREPPADPARPLPPVESDATAGAGRRSGYAFVLPPDLIAQEPAARREASRLLVLPRREGPVAHRRFVDLAEDEALLRAGDLLVLNDTRVLAARVEFTRASGGRVRGLCLEPPAAPSFRALLEGRGRLRAGQVLHGPGAASFTLLESEGGGAWRIGAAPAAAAALVAAGRMPLPPYIRRGAASDPRDEQDRSRYQTVFARHEGAVAAPTAGLHFTRELLDRLAARGVEIAHVTLHVGLGTFQPLRVEDLAEHRMHAERYVVPEATARAVAQARARGGRVTAVGTTVVRALETAARRRADGRLAAGAGETDLFIRPPFEFRVVDQLLTNFHLPGSTLLMLVAAFAARERVLDAYRRAVESGYRFFSYGDAMFLPDASAGKRR